MFQGPEFDWDNVIQGYILSSFFYGYLTTQLLGGLIGNKIGGKLVFGGGIAVTALVTLISPWLAEFSVYALLVARILMGVFEVSTFPRYNSGLLFSNQKAHFIFGFLWLVEKYGGKLLIFNLTTLLIKLGPSSFCN